MTGVFVSYSSKDLDILTPIFRMMQKNNIPFFKAPESIPQGSNYAKEIPGAIREYKVFCCLFQEIPRDPHGSPRKSSLPLTAAA